MVTTQIPFSKVGPKNKDLTHYKFIFLRKSEMMRHEGVGVGKVVIGWLG